MPITITAAEAPADRLLFDYIITYINKPDHASKIVALRALKLLVGTPFEADVRNRTAEIVEALCMDLEYDREIDAPDANTHAMEVINAFGLLSDAAAVEEHACMLFVGLRRALGFLEHCSHRVVEYIIGKLLLIDSAAVLDPLANHLCSCVHQLWDLDLEGFRNETYNNSMWQLFTRLSMGKQLRRMERRGALRGGLRLARLFSSVTDWSQNPVRGIMVELARDQAETALLVGCRLRVLPDVWRKVLSYACPLIESSPRNSGPMLGYPPGLKLKIRLSLDSYFELYGHVDHA